MKNKDPIEVCCRVRPLESSQQSVCLKVKDLTTLILVPPEPQSSKATKEVHYTFKKVFDDSTSQKELFDTVALPLVEDVLQGKNGLIFTYGITSSGKTYTMTGNPQDGGLLPRSLDVIFNSVKECQAPKFRIKPDKLNGFDFQSSDEAKSDQQREMRLLNKTHLRGSKRDRSPAERIPYDVAVEDIDPDKNFAIFVSYVEIYNNYIYDLLEDITVDPKRKLAFNSKMLREDAQHNMYVFGGTENEVKTVEEALDLFYKGQLRRRVSQTALNAESSRSHSVFTIRVVQAPLSPTGADLLMDKAMITIGQLSLVDLAGSERSVRTKNTGHKLREAGSINASLMTLRSCIELMRESQTSSGTRKIPYRDSKLTHLFKTYFEGQGKIKMVVCVNPQAEYYDETIHVMKFAEMTQDVLIARSVSTPVQTGLTPGRGKLYRDALKKAKAEGIPVAEIIAPAVFSLGPDFPSLTNLEDESAYLSMAEFLSARMNRRSLLVQDIQRRQDDFRKNLIAIDNENGKLKQEKYVLKMDLESRSQQIIGLEEKLISYEQSNEELRKQLSSCLEELESTKFQLEKTVKSATEQKIRSENLRIKMEEKLALEKDRMKRILEKRLAAKQAELELKMCITDEKFRQLHEILNADDWDYFAEPVPVPAVLPIITPPESSDSAPSSATSSKSRIVSSPKSSDVRFQRSISTSYFPGKNVKTVTRLFEKENRPPQPSDKRAVVNPRHRRSKSNSGGKWIDHKPIGNLDLGTVLQPTMNRKKSVSEIKLKDITKAGVSNYVLEHQEQDSKGEIEAHLYKADVIPSVTGGAQVVFNDIERVKRAPPFVSHTRKRSSDDVFCPDDDKCSSDPTENTGLPTKIMKTG